MTYHFLFYFRQLYLLSKVLLHIQKHLISTNLSRQGGQKAGSPIWDPHFLIFHEMAKNKSQNQGKSLNVQIN